jgi:2-(1,2-epoxy-1,2-dihydrophenyl)acetyl-CoA isomerase
MTDLLLDRDGAVATVTFNRPERLNAFTPEMNLELAALLRRLRDDEATSVVVLTGKGSAFSSGADLGAMSEPGRLGRSADVGYERVRAAGLRIEELVEYSKPTIAAVNGVVAGFAASLAFACDVILAAESSRFAIGFSKIGYVPDAGVSYFLPRLVGLHRAKEIFFRGEPIGAAEAERIGLVNRVVPDASCLDAALDLARTIAARPQQAIRMGKRLLDRAARSDFRTVVELEAAAQGILGTTEEHQAAVRAFTEKSRTNEK